MEPVMKIVFLDAYTTNKGDLSWSELHELGDFKTFERTPLSLIHERVKDADIIITNKAPLSKQTIENLPNLKYICVAATGVNIVDIDAAAEKGISVSNVAGYSTRSVAQIVFAHILNLVSKIEYQADTVSKDCWTNSKDFTYCDFPIYELSNMTLGIVGFGNIGRAVAKIANGFEMKINIFKPGEILDKPNYVNIVDKETLFNASDIITLHCPLNKKTDEFINKNSLAQMKESAYIINTGRGGLINEKDLADALNDNRIAGAGLDVLSSEPPKADNPLLHAKNCKITPHVAWSSVEARKKLIDGLVNNIKSFKNGKPINVVNM
jgi:glycerate dehydrogenase